MDAIGLPVAYVCYEEEADRRKVPNLMTKEEARRIAYWDGREISPHAVNRVSAS
jgi:hypothetical protein